MLEPLSYRIGDVRPGFDIGQLKPRSSSAGIIPSLPAPVYTIECQSTWTWSKEPRDHGLHYRPDLIFFSFYRRIVADAG